MRVQARIDTWLAQSLIVVAVLSCGPGLLAFFFSDNPPPLGLVLLPPAVWVAIFSFILPQSYDLRENGLFIRQGVRKLLLPYESLVEAQQFTSRLSSGAVLSSHRILLVTDTGRRHIIAVAQEKWFLDELAKRCPQLQKRPSGLGLPHSAPSFV